MKQVKLQIDRYATFPMRSFFVIGILYVLYRKVNKSPCGHARLISVILILVVAVYQQILSRTEQGFIGLLRENQTSVF